MVSSSSGQISFRILWISSILYTAYSSDFIYCENEVPWHQALDNCSEFGSGGLVERSIINQYKSSIASTQLEGQQFWTGDHTVLSPWISYLGCYRDVFYNIEVQSGVFDVASCQYRCQSQYLGIQNGSCICLDVLPYDRYKVNSDLCNLQFSNVYTDSCGGDGYFSVYSTYGGNRDEEEHHFQRCVYINCTASKVNLVAGPCEHHFPGICSSGTSFKVTDPGPWQSMSAACEKHPGKLLTTPVSNNVCTFIQKNHPNMSFWIDLHGYEMQHFSKSDLRPAYRCGTVIVDNSGIHTDFENCHNSTHTFPYICLTDNDKNVSLPESCRYLDVNLKQETYPSSLNVKTSYLYDGCSAKRENSGRSITTDNTNEIVTRNSGSSVRDKTRKSTPTVNTNKTLTRNSGNSGMTAGVVVTSSICVILVLAMVAVIYKSRKSLFKSMERKTRPERFNINSDLQLNGGSKKEVRYLKATDQEYASVDSHHTVIKAKRASDRAEIVQNEYYIDAEDGDQHMCHETGSDNGAGQSNVSYVKDFEDAGYSQIKHVEDDKRASSGRVVTTMPPEELDGIYDTAVAEIIFTRSMERDMASPVYDVPKECKLPQNNAYHQMSVRDRKSNDISNEVYVFMGADE